MSWIILEGLDRSGKTSVASLFKHRGHDVYHFSAPDKKYFNDQYVGPSYLDECLEIYMSFNGRDVVFDRSPYGEFVWPEVYGRQAQLSSDDIEILQEIEESNSCTKIYMQDPNFNEHWQRCVKNNEPITRAQFNKAVAFFERLEKTYSFERKSLSDFSEHLKEIESLPPREQEEPKTAGSKDDSKKLSPQQRILEEANAINAILSSPILRKKGEFFDKIEGDIRLFLQSKLGGLFGKETTNRNFSDEEILILKTYVSRIKSKMINGGKK